MLYSAVHEQRPDIVAMCHTHTIFGVAFASLGKKLEPITQDAAVFFEDQLVINDEAWQVSVEVEAGHKIANAFRGVKAAIHQNHGLITASRHSIEAAVFCFIALERCCQQQLMIDATASRRAWCRPIAPGTSASMSAANTSADCIFRRSGRNWSRRSRTCSADARFTQTCFQNFSK